MLLADLTRKAKSWPHTARLAWQVVWLVALVVGIDVVFSLGLTKNLPGWAIAILLAPFAVMVLTMIYDRVRRLGRAKPEVSTRG
jgi:protein-S-isoprenylcysteine O-methyltransferase Ste14